MAKSIHGDSLPWVTGLYLTNENIQQGSVVKIIRRFVRESNLRSRQIALLPSGDNKIEAVLSRLKDAGTQDRSLSED